jgi:hypothetical protein
MTSSIFPYRKDGVAAVGLSSILPMVFGQHSSNMSTQDISAVYREFTEALAEILAENVVGQRGVAVSPALVFRSHQRIPKSA